MSNIVTDAIEKLAATRERDYQTCLEEGFHPVLKASIDLFDGDVPTAIKWLEKDKNGNGNGYHLYREGRTPELLDFIARLGHGVFS